MKERGERDTKRDWVRERGGEKIMMSKWIFLGHDSRFCEAWNIRNNEKIVIWHFKKFERVVHCTIHM